MFSYARLKRLSIIIYYEENQFFKKNHNYIMHLKKAFKNIIFKIILVIFDQY